MPHFTEEQLQELETLYGLQRKDTLPIKDGYVSKTSKVWWRGANGPEHVKAEEHWDNIQKYPQLYSFIRPKIIYQD